jgi:hypothetical protein
MGLHGTLSVHATVFGTPRPGVAVAPRRLPWPAAALAIGSLSAGLWLGIVWLVTALG